MAASSRPSISTRGWMCALAVVGACLLLPATASAAPPTCPDVELTMHHDTVLVLDQNPCSGGNGELTLSPAPPDPTDGTLSAPNGVPQYAPDAGFVGTDSFGYKATDATPESSEPATVTVHVIDEAPTCEDTSTTTQQDTPVDINDLFVTTDPDDDNWTIGWSDGEHGVTDDQGTTYFPAPGFVGTDQIPFQAENRGLTSQVCTITITVTAKPAPPPPPPPPPPGPPVDVTKPVFSAAHPKQSLKDARTNGIKLTSTSDEAVTLVVTIKVAKKTARKLKIKRNAKRAVTVGTLTEAIAAGDSTVTVKLTKKAREAFKRAAKVKVLITMNVTDAAGNATTQSMTVTLKR